MEYFENHPGYKGKGSCIQILFCQRNTTYEPPSTEPKFMADYNRANRKKPVHIALFTGEIDLGEKSAFVLQNKEEIEKYWDIVGERESNVRQYIGVPILGKDSSVVMLLQIDVDKEDLFGETKEELEQFAIRAILPYVTVLGTVYRYENILQDLVKGLELTVAHETVKSTSKKRGVNAQ